MFVAASTRCFAEFGFEDACGRITDLEFDKVELWLDEQSEQLKPSELAADPESFCMKLRETTRLTPIAICLQHDTDLTTFGGLCKLAKLLRIAQITVSGSPLGTPFNTEIDRLRGLLSLASPDGIRISLKTMTGTLTEDAHTAVELCQSVSGLGITLDPSYYICGPQGSQPFDQVYPHVFHVHLRDTKPDELQVQVGLGDIDYSRMVNQLRRVNYAGSLSVEMIPAMIDVEARPLEMRKLRMLLETLL